MAVQCQPAQEDERVSGPPSLNSKYDVVVLGGGPAGLATAISVRQETNASVLVVDAGPREQERMGESCPPDVVLPLDRLGVLEAFRNSTHEPCPGYASMWGSDRVGYNDFIVNPLGPSWRLDRRLFDAMLLDRAQALGVQVAWSTRFQGIEERSQPLGGHGYALRLARGSSVQGTNLDHAGTEAQLVHARFVVDATGPEARFAQAMGIHKVVDDWLYATVRFATVLEGSGTRQVQLEAARDGWWYHARLPSSRVVSMVVTEKEFVPRLRSGNYAGFEEALSQTSFVGPSTNQLDLEDRTYHTRSIRTGRLPVVAGVDWMAVGDAAASFDPVAAQGIYKGLNHGLIAGRVVAARLASAPVPVDFASYVDRQYDAYRENRHHVYGLERRWAASPFWRNRIGAK